MSDIYTTWLSYALQENSPFCLFVVNTFKLLEWVVYRFGFDCCIDIEKKEEERIE